MKLWTGVSSPYGPDLVLILDTALLPQDIHTLWNPRLLRAVVDIPQGALLVYCANDLWPPLPMYANWQPWEGEIPAVLQALYMCEVFHVTANSLYVELDTNDGTYYTDNLMRKQWVSA